MYNIVTVYYDDNTNIFSCDRTEFKDVNKLMTIKEILDYKTKGGIYYTKPNNENVVYEIIFPIRDEKRTLCYDSSYNVMFDEYGCIVYNIFQVISPTILSIFKNKKETMTVHGLNGSLVELRYNEGIW